MNRIVKAFSALAVLTFVLGPGRGANAEGVYAYAKQNLSNFSIEGGTVDALRIGTQTTLAFQQGDPTDSEAHIGFDDIRQAYVGSGPRPSEKFFDPVGQDNPDYVRGDVLVTTTPGGLGVSSVAEGYLVTLPGLSLGSSFWSMAADLTVTDDPFVLSFDYDDILEIIYDADAPARSVVSAQYSFNFEVRDLATNEVVFASAPNAVNRSINLIRPGQLQEPWNDTVTIEWTAATPGTYQAMITGETRVLLAVIPEPSSVALVGLGMVGLLGYGIRRRRVATR